MMLTNFTEANKCYREGLEELLFVSPLMGTLARSMGAPLWEHSNPTAWVTYDTDERRVVFAINPDFIESLSVDEAAAVIAHEAHHVVLNHLNEMKSGLFPDSQALLQAHECIINDNIDNVFQLPLPAGSMKGPELVGCDCSQMGTQEAYDLFKNIEKNEDSPSNSADDATSDEDNETQDSPSNGGTPDNGEGERPTDEGKVTDGDRGEDNQESNHGCSGVIVPDDFDEEMRDGMKTVVNKAASDMGVTLEEFNEMASNSSAPSFSPFGGTSGIIREVISSERMNWLRLLALINPKILQAGSPRAKAKNNWTKSNRRLTSVYPRVILPMAERTKPKKADKGDTLPVFVVALDLSGSINRSLINTLQGLLAEIPENLIKAYPCTWSDFLVPFGNGEVCESGGTRIQSVVTYVEQIKAETGTDPYVLCITDGQYSKPPKLPGKKWFYMGVDRRSVKTITQGFGYGRKGLVDDSRDEVYCVNDFKV